MEGSHAGLHHAVQHARSRTEQYDSLNRRLPEIRSLLSTPDGFSKFADALVEVRNPKQVVKKLGLVRHPRLAEVTWNWDPSYALVVYRADPFILFTRPMPELQLDDDAGGAPPPALQPPPAAAAPNPSPAVPDPSPTATWYTDLLSRCALRRVCAVFRDEAGREDAYSLQSNQKGIYTLHSCLAVSRVQTRPPSSRLV